MPRITQVIGTPAREASYSRSISRSSTRLFIFSHIPAGLPARALAISLSISAAMVRRVVSGLKAICSIASGLA